MVVTPTHLLHGHEHYGFPIDISIEGVNHNVHLWLLYKNMEKFRTITLMKGHSSAWYRVWQQEIVRTPDYQLVRQYGGPIHCCSSPS